MPLVTFIVFAVALGNIWIAKRYANYGNSTLRNTLSIECDEQCSKWCLASLHRIHLSVFQFTLSFMFMTIWLAGSAEINFSKRMLNFIEEHTNSEKSTCSNQSPEEHGPNGQPSA